MLVEYAPQSGHTERNGWLSVCLELVGLVWGYWGVHYVRLSGHTKLTQTNCTAEQPPWDRQRFTKRWDYTIHYIPDRK